jgi:hypothetical protein
MPAGINVINLGYNCVYMAPRTDRANIKISPNTRDRVKSLKRGGESYDELLQKMAEQYDPEEAKN